MELHQEPVIDTTATVGGGDVHALRKILCFVCSKTGMFDSPSDINGVDMLNYQIQSH